MLQLRKGGNAILGTTAEVGWKTTTLDGGSRCDVCQGMATISQVELGGAVGGEFSRYSSAPKRCH